MPFHVIPFVLHHPTTFIFWPKPHDRLELRFELLISIPVLACQWKVIEYLRSIFLHRIKLYYNIFGRNQTISCIWKVNSRTLMHLKYAYLNNREWKIDVCIYCSRYNDFINVNPFNSAKQRNLYIYLFLILPTHPKTAVYSACYISCFYIYTQNKHIYVTNSFSEKVSPWYLSRDTQDWYSILPQK